ncbi:MAG: alkane 1-monooxygenase [Gammaproteobacteria bacterium]|nr:alkane 1-monooxygenase [Gammaproteobacteria bacterium]
MWKYLKYTGMNVLLLLSLPSILLGGWWMWAGVVLTLLVALVLDQVIGDDLTEPEYQNKAFLNVMLFSTLPVLAMGMVGLAWVVADHDFLAIGALVQQLTGIDVLARREANELIHLVGAVLSGGMMIAFAGTNVGHELTHRTWDPKAMIFGRWMLSMSSDASFAIEHVYGHHNNVSTRKDPATSRRGENVWSFVLRSTVHSYISAWNIEKARLERQGYSVWSWRNRMHRGNLMTLTWAAMFYVAGGWMAAGVFAITSLWGKSWLEYVNYIEHYGMVRVPGKPVQPRHSWNSNKAISGMVLYNLTRHSHHHAMGEKPFWDLRPYPNCPMMPYGYLTMIFVAWLPPLWRKIMDPKVLEWDRVYAHPEEYELIEEANRLSGHKHFMGSKAHLEKASGTFAPA